MVREDERGAPRHEVTCHRCGTCVLVKKNSLAHTAVQWVSATDRCVGLVAGAEDPSGVAPTCRFLRDSIDDGVRAGSVEVPDLTVGTSPE